MCIFRWRICYEEATVSRTYELAIQNKALWFCKKNLCFTNCDYFCFFLFGSWLEILDQSLKFLPKLTPCVIRGSVLRLGNGGGIMLDEAHLEGGVINSLS